MHHFGRKAVTSSSVSESKTCHSKHITRREGSNSPNRSTENSRLLFPMRFSAIHLYIACPSCAPTISWWESFWRRDQAPGRGWQASPEHGWYHQEIPDTGGLLRSTSHRRETVSFTPTSFTFDVWFRRWGLPGNCKNFNYESHSLVSVRRQIKAVRLECIPCAQFCTYPGYVFGFVGQILTLDEREDELSKVPWIRDAVQNRWLKTELVARRK